MAYALFGVLPKEFFFCLFFMYKESHTLKNVYVSIDIHCSKVPKLIFYFDPNVQSIRRHRGTLYSCECREGTD